MRDRLRSVVRWVAVQALAVSVGKPLDRQGPLMRVGLPNSYRERFFVVLNRVLNVLRTIAGNPIAIRGRQVVFGHRPTLRMGLSCTNFKCSVIYRDRLLNVVSP